MSPSAARRSADLADVEIRSYRPADEPSWLRCRVLAFLHLLDLDREAQMREAFGRVYVCRCYQREV